MRNLKALICAFSCMLFAVPHVHAMHYLFPHVSALLFGTNEQKKQKKPQKIPELTPLPQTLSAQSNTLIRNKSEGMSSTVLPHAVSHVPLPGQKSAHADDIRALDVAKSIENALKNKEGIRGPIFVNINLNGQTVTESTAIANSTHTADSLDWFKKYKKRAECSCFDAFRWIQNNKKRFSLYCLGGTYLCTQMYLWYLAHALRQQSCWSLWKNHCSLEDLYRYKQSELAKEIIDSMHTRYDASYNPPDNALLVTKFVKEVDVELKMLTRYRTIVNVIESLYMRKIFFYNAKLHQELSDRINRLLFIKNSFSAVSEQRNQERPQL